LTVIVSSYYLGRGLLKNIGNEMTYVGENI